MLISPQMGYMPPLALLESLPFKPQMAKDMDRILELCEQLAVERAKRGNDDVGEAKDVCSYLLNAKDPETGAPGMSQDELYGELTVLMVAGGSSLPFPSSLPFQRADSGPSGSDTTALAIVTAIYQLAKHPQCLARLRAELDAAFADVEAIRWGPALSSCAYLRACLDEAMRLSPPVGGVLPRLVLDPGATVAGTAVPAGAVVGVPAYALHRDPKAFPDPHRYRPERWTASEAEAVTEADVKRAQHAFFAFNIGPRACLGKHLAYVEMSVAVARIVWLYAMEIVREPKLAGWLEGMREEGGMPTVDKFVSHPAGETLYRFRSQAR